MANIIQMGNGDKTLVLGQREALVYPLPYEDWNDLKVGAFLSVCPPSGDYNHPISSATNQEIDIGGPSDKWYFGLKNNTNNLPGENGEPFVGWSHRSGDSECSFNFNPFHFGGGSSTDNVSTVTIMPNGQVHDFDDLNYYWLNNSADVASGNYCAFIGLRLTVLNKGTSTQKIRVGRYPNNAASATNDTSDQALKDALASNYGGSHDFEYQLGGVPLPLPTSIVVYSPFTKVQLRVHNIGALKAS